jgi:hypothetical protein
MKDDSKVTMKTSARFTNLRRRPKEVDQEQERKEMTWEENKYDGQQDSDKFQQNEILRRIC